MDKISSKLRTIIDDTNDYSGKETFELLAGILGLAVIRSKKESGARDTIHLLNIIRDMVLDCKTDLMRDTLK